MPRMRRVRKIQNISPPFRFALLANSRLKEYTSPCRFLTKRVSDGAVAQLGERSVRNAEVVGSIPIGSTNPADIETIPPIFKDRSNGRNVRRNVRRFVRKRIVR